MQIIQTQLKLKPYKRGFHLITDVIEEYVKKSAITRGTINILLQHTSASLCLNENADPEVREDMERFYKELADNKRYYIHTYEGADDMPAHVKSSLLGATLTLPINNGHLALGTWQGIYLGEHRDKADARSLMLTIMGE